MSVDSSLESRGSFVNDDWSWSAIRSRFSLISPCIRIMTKERKKSDRSPDAAVEIGWLHQTPLRPKMVAKKSADGILTARERANWLIIP
jgi:hypothetical protein